MGRERTLHALLLALTAVGCDRAPATAPPPTAAPTTAAPIATAPTAPTAPTRVVVPTEAAPIVGAPEPSPETGSAPGAAAATPPTSTEPRAAKPTPRKGSAVTVGGAPAQPTAPPAPPATPFTPKRLVSDKLFRIELAPLAPCKPAAPCEASLVVHALGGYKVNAEYPTKFVATASPAVTVEGTGRFAVTDKTTGTMTVTFRATTSGTATLSGVLKLSVCTDEICEIAAPSIAFDVPVIPP